MIRGGYSYDGAEYPSHPVDQPKHHRYRSSMKGVSVRSSVASSVRFQDDYDSDDTSSVMQGFQHR